jgi:outer membrane protein assembly factor BamE
MRMMLSAVLAVGLAGCGVVYKLDIQQGNILDQEDVAELEIGMTKRQIELLLGSPSISSPFHANRWDYMNTYSERGGEPVRRVLTLGFDDNRLVSVDGNYLDQDSVAARALRELQRPEEAPIQDLETLREDS